VTQTLLSAHGHECCSLRPALHKCLATMRRSSWLLYAGTCKSSFSSNSLSSRRFRSAESIT
jgi:hypothetical protein